MKKAILAMFVIGMLTFMAGFAMAAVNGAETVTEEGSSTANATDATSHDAIAGNVTEITISGDSVTQTWQGYYGNVSGAITLENSAGNVMYNWSLASPQGEIYASNDSNVEWASIECFNYTANGTAVESWYNIDSGDADGIDETFQTGLNHDAFDTGTTSFAQDQCMSMRVFDSTGQGVDNTFEEVLLWDGTELVFAALLEEDVAGFDGATHDFQMLVVEDGHSGDASTTPYYFYVELA